MRGNVDSAQQGYWVLPYPFRPGAVIGLRGILPYAGLALASLYAFLYALADIGILDGNEALYVESAREMALTHTWAVPNLDGLPYLEKPPLFIWLIVAMNGLTHSVELGPRLVSVGAALLLVFGVLRFAARLGLDWQGNGAAFMLASSVGTILMARVAMPDMLLTTLFTLACFAFLVALRENIIGFARMAAGLLGAASLVKGLLAAMLFGLLVVACYVMEKTWRRAIRRFLCDPWAVLLALVPLLAWLVAIDAALPGAASYFIIDEHILRFLGQREPHDYYFIDSKSNDLDFGRRVLKRAPTLVTAAEVHAVAGAALIVVLKNRQPDFERTQLAARAVEVARIGRATLFRISSGRNRESGGRAFVADPEVRVVAPA